MTIEITYRQVGLSKLAVRRNGMLYVATEKVRHMLLEEAWAVSQLAQPECLLNRARNMTNHELARERLELADNYLDGDGLTYARWTA
jgi:hypothetical protein